MNLFNNFIPLFRFEDATKASNAQADQVFNNWEKKQNSVNTFFNYKAFLTYFVKTFCQADVDIRDYGKKVHNFEIEFDETNDKLQKAIGNFLILLMLVSCKSNKGTEQQYIDSIFECLLHITNSILPE